MSNQQVLDRSNAVLPQNGASRADIVHPASIAELVLASIHTPYDDGPIRDEYRELVNLALTRSPAEALVISTRPSPAY